MSSEIRVGTALLVCAAICKLCAQTSPATLVGNVVDPSGAVVVGASVEVRNSATNESRKLKSDQRGDFIAPNLAPGVYEVVISKEGFQTLRQTGIELQLEQQARISFRLEVGAVSQSVEVTGSAPLVNTENGSKGDVVMAQEMIEMPLNGRDFTDLALLTAGALPNAQGAQGSEMAINGARADNTNFVLDGFNNQSSRDGTVQVRPNLDALQEFKMQTSGYSAESGRLAGGVMNMALKSGGNQFHGAAFEFLRNDLFDARNFFNTTKSELRRNQFGGMLDGPVLIPGLYNGRDRTFFLFSWESYRQRSGQTRLGIVPDEAQRRGDFAAFAPIKDPLATGTCSAANRAACFPNNQIPASRLSPIALAVQQYYPPPNRPGLANNYYVDAHTPADWDSLILKFDETVAANHALTFRYLKRYDRSTNPFNGANLGTFGSTTRTHNLLAGLSYTAAFRPTLINEARFALTRTPQSYRGNHQGTDYAANFGITGVSSDPAVVGFPFFQITNYESLGDAANMPNAYIVNNYDTSDTMTWVKGAHVMKFGGSLLRFQFFQTYYNDSRGTFNFTGQWTTQPYADFLLGYLVSSTHQVPAAGYLRSYLSANNYSAFYQDDWKVTSRLTLNLGLRYELPMPLADKYGRWTNFIPELNKLVIASDATLAGSGLSFTNSSLIATAKSAGLPRSLVYPDYRDWAPRLGLAWRPFGGNRTVLRGGYGVFYGGMENLNLRNALTSVFPFVVNQTTNRNANNPQYLTLATPFPAPPVLTTNASTITVKGYQLHAPTPYLQSWNLTIERELGQSAAVEIGYAGSKGTHLSKILNINQPFRSAATAPSFPVPYPGWSTINYYAFHFNSIYNSGSITVRRRFARGFFYRASYVYAKSIDYASQATNVSSAGGYATFQDPRNYRGERGRSDFDIGHSFTMMFSWRAPWQRNLLLRGWQLAGTGAARTGAPFTPQVSNVNLNLGEANRPNRIAKGTLPDPSPDTWFDIAAFPVVPSGSFAFGDSGRNILDGPGRVGMNFSFSRNFKVREKGNLQFRWEVFNVLNHPPLTLPVVNVNAPNGATIRSAGDPRLMQFGFRFSF